ncbi:2111_t:CDS:2 [Diversispora eburnea]|uniref:2111_t:CDS:1 n=1 Tax=Diversispora eburnea TaxID=1213867 RepID=A0A9N9B193_9GLOM|nr:2111_t:CDS:2 [Diversispora eburnea]
MNQKIWCQKCEKDIPCKNCQKEMVKNQFSNWSCGNPKLDQYLKKKQIEAIDYSINIPVKWIPSEEFEDIQLLKCGGEGKIYSSYWNNGPLNLGKERVALKCLHSSTHDVDKFIKELDLQVSLCHTNTPLCYGVSRLSFSSTSPYAIVMEYAEDGDLKHYIQTNFKSIRWREKLELIEPKLRPSADDLHQTFEKWLFDDQKHENWERLEIEGDDYENIEVETKNERTRSICISLPVTSQINFVIPDNFKWEDEDSE